MFGDRLKLARKKAGHSLRQLSRAMGGSPSAQAIGKYERGEMMPGSSVLIQLTKALDVSLEYLLSEQVDRLDSIEFRKLSGTSAKDRASVEAAVIDSLQRYLAIEDILGLGDGPWAVPESGDRFLGHESEGEVLAQDIRREWKLGIDPIPNVTSLLEDHGIKVLVMPLRTGISGLTCVVHSSRLKKQIPAIVVNQHNTLERRRFTLAHELAHRLIEKNSFVDHEKASDVFAGAFLVPRDHLEREIGRHRKSLGYRELMQLKRMYRVSAARLLVRLGQTGVISQSAVDRAFQSFAANWRRHEPEPLEIAGSEGKLEYPQRFERLCYWALAEDYIDHNRARELLRKSLEDIEKGLKGPAAQNADDRR